MLLWLLAGLFLLILVLAALGWFANAPPGDVLRVLRWTAVVAGIGLFLLVLLGAARQLLALALPLLLPLLARLPELLRRLRGVSGPASAKVSTVETRFLRMELEHDSGAMVGTVLEGRHRGRRLSELPLEELVELWIDYRVEDEQSADVLQAYLDRSEGPDWRHQAGVGREEDAGRSSGPSHQPMGVEEARAILGVGPHAGEAEIRAAHRRLMQQMHPDRGGSDYLAAKVNEARQVLLDQATS